VTLHRMTGVTLHSKEGLERVPAALFGLLEQTPPPTTLDLVQKGLKAERVWVGNSVGNSDVGGGSDVW